MNTILNNKTDILGIYTVKSPYHKEAHYLPFVILNYLKDDNTYRVMTIEYKGQTSYIIDTFYSEKSIQAHISQDIIQKKANPDNFRDNADVKELLNQFYKCV